MCSSESVYSILIPVLNNVSPALYSLHCEPIRAMQMCRMNASLCESFTTSQRHSDAFSLALSA